ncbi:hypothetical protein DITRI_Ditri01bG0191100 [Diplodiscus trichospermus]
MKQKIVIKVSMHCDKCRAKAMKIAAAVDGVVSVALHGPDKDKLMITGDGIDAVCLTSCLRKELCHATIETVEEVKDQKKSEEKKKDEGKKDGDKKDGGKKDQKPAVACCSQPQPAFIVVNDPYPGTCTIM